MRMKPSPVVALLVLVRFEPLVGRGEARAKVMLVRFKAIVGREDARGKVALVRFQEVLERGDARAKVVVKEAMSIGRDSMIAKSQAEVLSGVDGEEPGVARAVRTGWQGIGMRMASGDRRFRVFHLVWGEIEIEKERPFKTARSKARKVCSSRPFFNMTGLASGPTWGQSGRG